MNRLARFVLLAIALPMAVLAQRNLKDCVLSGLDQASD